MALLKRKPNRKTTDIHIRLTREEFELLKKIAAEEVRTVSGCARILMLRAARARKEK